MKSKYKYTSELNRFDFKAFLNQLGPTLMLPILLVVFSAISFGVSSILPSEFFITKMINSIASTTLLFFPMLVFYSVVIHYNKKIDDFTMIKATIVVLTYISLSSIIYDIEFLPGILFNIFGEQSSYVNESYGLNLLSYSIFSMILLALAFNWFESKIGPLLILIVSILVIIMLFPIFIFISFSLIFIGKILSILPFGLSSFTYGVLNRLLIPFGLHSALFPTFLYTPVGGTMKIFETGTNEVINTISGDSNIWLFMYNNGIDFNSLSGTLDNGNTYEVINNNNIAQYSQGFLPMLSFAFPMIGITYILIVGWDEGKLMLLVTVTTACTGVTEFTEYTFVFINPILYLVNALIFGLSFWLMNIFDAHVFISMGWVFDIFTYGLIPSIKGFKTNWWLIPIIGILLGALYSSIFYFLHKNEKLKINLEWK